MALSIDSDLWDLEEEERKRREREAAQYQPPAVNMMDEGNPGGAWPLAPQPIGTGVVPGETPVAPTVWEQAAQEQPAPIAPARVPEQTRTSASYSNPPQQPAWQTRDEDKPPVVPEQPQWRTEDPDQPSARTVWEELAEQPQGRIGEGVIRDSHGQALQPRLAESPAEREERTRATNDQERQQAADAAKRGQKYTPTPDEGKPPWMYTQIEWLPIARQRGLSQDQAASVHRASVSEAHRSGAAVPPSNLDAYQLVQGQQVAPPRNITPEDPLRRAAPPVTSDGSIGRLLNTPVTVGNPDEDAQPWGKIEQGARKEAQRERDASTPAPMRWAEQNTSLGEKIRKQEAIGADDFMNLPVEVIEWAVEGLDRGINPNSIVDLLQGGTDILPGGPAAINQAMNPRGRRGSSVLLAQGLNAALGLQADTLRKGGGLAHLAAEVIDPAGLVAEKALGVLGRGTKLAGGVPSVVGAVTGAIATGVQPDSTWEDVGGGALVGAGIANLPRAVRAGGPSIAAGARRLADDAAEVGEALVGGPSSMQPPGMRPALATAGGPSAPPSAAPLNVPNQDNIIPVEVARELNTRVEIPDDPEFLEAVKRAGGRVTPDGVEFNFIRYQKGAQEGAVSPRGAVFYEPKRPGSRGSYKTEPNEADATVGGDERVEGPTLVKRPLVVTDGNVIEEAARVLRVPLPVVRDEAWELGLEMNGQAAKAARYPDTTPPISADPRVRQEAIRKVRVLLSRYNGDPNLAEGIVDYIDWTEWTNAIPENVMARAARREGYDSIFTMEPAGTDWRTAVPTPPRLREASDLREPVFPTQAGDFAVRNEFLDPRSTGQGVPPRVDRSLPDEELAGLSVTDEQFADLQQRLGPRSTGGTPPTLYHGTSADFDQFDLGYAGSNKDAGLFGRGVYLAEDAEGVKAYGPNVLSVQHGIENPYAWPAEAGNVRTVAQGMGRLPAGIHDAALARYRELAPPASSQAPGWGSVGGVADDQLDERVLAQAVTDVLQSRGHDGVRYLNPYAARQGAQQPEYVAFAPERFQGVERVQPPFGPRTTGGVAPEVAAATAGAATGDEETTLEERARNAGLAAAGMALPRFLRKPGVRSAIQPPHGHLYTNQARQPSAQNPNIVTAFMNRAVRQLTDRHAAINQIQETARKELGRPLLADEMAAYQARIDPNRAAEMRLLETLRPALLDVGDDIEHLRDYMTYQDMIDVAAATGNPNRQFSGGLTLQDAHTNLTWMQQNLPPATMQRIQQAAGSVRKDLVDHYRKRFLDEGIWSQKLYDDLTQKYPNYVPTRILDYMGDHSTLPGGQRIGLDDQGLRKNTAQGTTKEREDVLASLVRYAYDAERRIQRNKAGKALIKLRDAGVGTLAADIPDAPPGYHVKPGEQILHVFDGGDHHRYIVPKALSDAVEYSIPHMSVPLFTGLANFIRAATTSRNPVFLTANAALDAAGYMMREGMREGGPWAIPKVAAALGQAYAEILQEIPDLLKGTYSGDTARFLKQGGGQAGFFRASPEDTAKTVRDISKRNIFEIRDIRDAGQFLGDLATFRWVEDIGERIELAPRKAAMRLGEERAAREMTAGMPPGTQLPPQAQQAVDEAAQLRGTIGGRTVTIDFNTGGTTAKWINGLVPFFNVAIQGSATPLRAFKENPVGFAAIATSVMATQVGIEAWNRQNPELSQQYDDIPQHAKDRGIIIMLPGVVGQDERGDARPNFVLIPMREWAALTIATREAMTRAFGGEPQTLKELAASLAGSASPIQGETAADLLVGHMPAGTSQALQLAINKDTFRNRAIQSERSDDEASSLSKWISQTGIGTPGQVEFTGRDIAPGFYGPMAAASNMITGRTKDENRIQNMPVVGGLVGRWIRDDIGGNLDRAQDRHTVDPIVERALKEAGMKPEQIGTIKPTYTSVGREVLLTKAEQAQAQQIANAIAAKELARKIERPYWKNATKEQREEEVRGAWETARKSAVERLKPNAPEEKRRVDRDKARKARNAP